MTQSDFSNKQLYPQMLAADIYEVDDSTDTPGGPLRFRASRHDGDVFDSKDHNPHILRRIQHVDDGTDQSHEQRPAA